MAWVLLDWGTSSLRGALVDDEGAVQATQQHALGILQVPAGGFAALFERLFGQWMAQPGTRCLIAGMAGSQQGWLEAPYCPCPAGLSELAAHIVAIEPGRIAVVPGLRDAHDGVPDVMRGEEVQILGAMALTGLQSGCFILPGTHSKWARVREGRVQGFHSFMTGEFYALLSQHSILARTLDAQAPLEAEAFLRGVRQAGNKQGLLHNAFGARTQALLSGLAPAASASYLSGVLIGEELQAQTPAAGEAVVLIGAEALATRYALALESLGIRARCLGPEASWAGLHALARTLDETTTP